jgi:hypothetical protein
MAPRCEFASAANSLSVMTATPDDPCLPVVGCCSPARNIPAVTDSPPRCPSTRLLQPEPSTAWSPGKADPVAKTAAVGQTYPTKQTSAEWSDLQGLHGSTAFRVRDVTDG